MLGFDLESVAPSVGYDGRLRPKPCQRDLTLMPTSSAFECTFQRDMVNMLSISTVPQSKVSPIQQTTPVRPTAKTAMYSDILVKSVNGYVFTSVFDTTPKWAEKFSKFLNQSEVLDLRYTIGGREVMYFIKTDADAVEDELGVLGIHGKMGEYGNGINVTVNRLSHPDGYRIASYTETDVRFHGNYSVINVRYGSNYDHERHRVVRHAKERAVHRAWAREKWLILNSLPTYHSWTEQERQQIKSAGYLEGFDTQFTRDPLVYPEAADDCNNVRFVRVKR